MKKVQADIPLDYITIKVTQSRINKGLLAIPVSLLDWFPNTKQNINIVAPDGEMFTCKVTPYNSTSRECRIGGLNRYFQKYQVKSGNELVIQLLNDESYRLIPETLFKSGIRSYEKQIENTENEDEAEKLFNELSQLTNFSKSNVIQNEFVRLSNKEFESRKRQPTKARNTRESVPTHMKNMLSQLYEGKCQLTGFTFLKKDNNPYFEIHHINPELGNHLKNLLVVSPNIHAQFTHANVHQKFGDNGWLRKVYFNQEEYSVFQVIDSIEKQFYKEVHE